MPDLWSVPRADIDRAARGLCAERGLRAARVYPLGTGLWVSVQLESGALVSLNDSEIQNWLWAQRRL